MEEKEGVRDRVLGWSVVCQRVKGGGRGGELVNLPYAKTSFRTAMLL